MAKTFEKLHAQSFFSPSDLKRELPASEKQLEFVEKSRRDIIKILNGEDQRLLLIIGPCSIHDDKSAKEYAMRLQDLSMEFSKFFLILMRTYFEKPRSALGWKGMIYDPHLDGSNDIASGLRQTRELLLWLAEIGIGTATEFLEPIMSGFYSDLICWGCIGARTAESQIHRQFASGLQLPIAFKNSTTGNIEVAINGVIAASYPHCCLGINEKGNIALIKTEGNPNSHIVLRGGENHPNYDFESIDQALERLKKFNLPQRLVVDCSHDNSFRNHENQILVFKSVIEQYSEGNNNIRGVILESHLEAGSQHIPFDKEKLQYGISLTDACLNWKSTEHLVRWANNIIEKKRAEALSPYASENG